MNPIGLALLILSALGGTAYVYEKKKKTVPSQGGTGPLDSNIPAEAGIATGYALQHETNRANLKAFGDSMLPDYPIAAATLIAHSGFTVKPGSIPTNTISAVQQAQAKPKIAMTISHGIAHGDSSFGDLIDIVTHPADDISAAAGAVSDVGNALIHPADTASGAWHAVTHPTDSINDFAQSLIDIVHVIPGMDWAGDRLKDFANTDFGQWALRIMATYGYYVCAPYLGAQLASISFAMPGLAQNKPFVESWIKETINRIIKTANILLQNSIPDLGDATNEQLNKFLAENPQIQQIVKNFTDQIGSAQSQLQKVLGPIGDEIANAVPGAIQKGITELGKKYGAPPDFNQMGRLLGVRADNAAAAYDIIFQTHWQNTLHFDAITGDDMIAKVQSVKNGDTFYQTAHTHLFTDKRMTKLDPIQVNSIRSNTLAERNKWINHYLELSGA